MEPAAARRSRRRVAGERPCQLPPCGLQAATARAGCRAAPAQLPGEAQSILQMRSAAAGPARARSQFRLEPRLCCQRAHRCCVWCPPQARSSVRPSQAARSLLTRRADSSATRQKVVLRFARRAFKRLSSPKSAANGWCAGDLECWRHREARARAPIPPAAPKSIRRGATQCAPPACTRPSQFFPTLSFRPTAFAAARDKGLPPSTLPAIWWWPAACQAWC